MANAWAYGTSSISTSASNLIASKSAKAVFEVINCCNFWVTRCGGYIFHPSISYFRNLSFGPASSNSVSFPAVSTVSNANDQKPALSTAVIGGMFGCVAVALTALALTYIWLWCRRMVRKSVLNGLLELHEKAKPRHELGDTAVYPN
jgi:hypothetical protein